MSPAYPPTWLILALTDDPHRLITALSLGTCPLNDQWRSLSRDSVQIFRYKSSHSLKWFMADSVWSDFSEGRFSPGLLEARRREISKEARSREQRRRGRAQPDPAEV